MRKRMIILIICLIVVFGGIFGWKAFVSYKISQFLAHRTAPPVTVATTHAQKAQWTPRLASTGSLRAVQGVDITTEVAGKVVKIAFKSGQNVAKGDLLVALDTDIEKAQLAGLRAQLELNRLTEQRKSKLHKRGVGSQASLDEAAASYKNSRAGVRAKQAEIDKKTITAPFAGTLGLRHADEGEYLAPGTPIVTLQALDPIYLDFSLPQQDLEKIHTGQTVSLYLDALEDSPVQGKITAISPKVDAGSRSFSVRAQLNNKDQRLRPGMFGRVDVVLDQSNDVLTLPQTAISYNPYGDTVFKVVKQEAKSSHEKSDQKSDQKSDNKPTLIAKRINVRTGETRGDQVQILSGLKPGDEVVVAGQLKLRGGDVINIDNSILPQDKADPAPVENY